MSTEEERSFQTYQDSDYIEHPQDEKEASNLIKKSYKKNSSVELIGSGSKRKLGKAIQCNKILSLSRINGNLKK